MAESGPRFAWVNRRQARLARIGLPTMDRTASADVSTTNLQFRPRLMKACTPSHQRQPDNVEHKHLGALACGARPASRSVAPLGRTHCRDCKMGCMMPVGPARRDQSQQRGSSRIPTAPLPATLPSCDWCPPRRPRPCGAPVRRPHGEGAPRQAGLLCSTLRRLLAAEEVRNSPIPYESTDQNLALRFRGGVRQGSGDAAARAVRQHRHPSPRRTARRCRRGLGPRRRAPLQRCNCRPSMRAKCQN